MSWQVTTLTRLKHQTIAAYNYSIDKNKQVYILSDVAWIIVNQTDADNSKETKKSQWPVE